MTEKICWTKVGSFKHQWFWLKKIVFFRMTAKIQKTMILSLLREQISLLPNSTSLIFFDRFRISKLTFIYICICDDEECSIEYICFAWVEAYKWWVEISSLIGWKLTAVKQSFLVPLGNNQYYSLDFFFHKSKWWELFWKWRETAQ